MQKRLTRDLWRSNVSIVVSSVVTTVVIIVAGFMDNDLDMLSGERWSRAFLERYLVPYYLLDWTLYCLLVAVLTHIAYTRIPDDELGERALAGNQNYSPRMRFFGAMGAMSLAVQAALVSGVLTLIIAQSETYRENRVVIVLALLNVAGSWLSIVYFFALDYLRRWARGVPVDLGLGETEQPRFVDFLYFAISVATLMGGAMRWKSREGRRAVALNSALALVFNTIVLAITVALVVN